MSLGSHYSFSLDTDGNTPSTMNTLIIASCILACAFAFTPEANVHITQDTVGNYKLILHDKDVSREEEGFADGRVVGSYEFSDKDGVVHTINFVASKDGYVPKGSDIPVSVEEPIEIAKTRAHHQATVDHLYATLPKLEFEETPVDPKEAVAKFTVPEIATLPADFVPAEDSENIAAKGEFLKAYADALSLLKQEYEKL